MQVLLGSEPIAGSPFAVEVLPAPAHAPACLIVLPPPPTLHAGHSALLRVECRDAFGNRCRGGDELVASLDRDRSELVAARAQGAAQGEGAEGALLADGCLYAGDEGEEGEEGGRLVGGSGAGRGGVARGGGGGAVAETTSATPPRRLWMLAMARTRS